ncbi:MAG: beta-propeller domain-containing protein [Deltaproteobacteria bacterium]|nr:beta-propeller domain-containing protein [Deltaproteobacteria bacterium]
MGPCALLATAAGALAFYTCGRHQPTTHQVISQATREHLVAFTSEEELMSYLRRMGEAQRRQMYGSNPNAGKQDMADGGVPGGGTIDFDDGTVSGDMAAPAAEAPSPSPTAPAARRSRARSESRSTTSGRAQQQAESITSTQEQGIDEGDIVKAHGDQLIVLRRGRLFSIGIAGGRLTPIDAVNAYPEGARPASWYDEMLIHDDTIVVVGFSYHGEGTEIGLFHIDDAGRITHRNTYYLKSNDYYSARNYASRLLGSTLLFYMPYYMLDRQYTPQGVTYNPSLPSMRRFQNGATVQDGWHSIVRATQVYRPIQRTEAPVLHTVVSCDLSTPQPTCQARGILGPDGRTFYVSSSAVYVWVSDERRRQVREEPDDDPAFRVQWNGPQPTSVLYRLPLDGSEPGALRAWGVPTDQFSFQERDGMLNVLLRAAGGGDMMWGSEITSGDVGLLRVSVASITAGVANARREDYRDLPRPGLGYVFQNRFVGNHVLYGTGTGWGPPQPSDRRIYVHSVLGRNTEPMELPGGTDRIEPMDEDAVVVGTDGRDLHFTSIRLDPGPTIAGSYVERNASQGETRSHGFFFRPDGEEDGMLGLPVRSQGGRPGWEQLFTGSAGVLFLRVDDLRFRLLGALGSRASESVRDHCVASCVDWYGNSRPIFYRDRVFALLGYEMVEGRVDRRSIREVQRIDMSSAIRPPVATPPR